MSEHPPGPYKIARNEGYPRVVDTRIDILAPIPGENLHYVIAKVLPIGYPETDHVANLFVTAPELLESATMALDFLDKYFADLDVPPEELDGVYVALQNTIVKAGGER